MAVLYLITVFTLFLLTSNAEEITVKSGDDVTLQCQSPSDEAITAFKWSKLGLKTDLYVFFFRENRPYESFQHGSFRGRVQLRNQEMKDGNVPVTLKNVTINDTGTYKCHVSVNSTELINTTINLKVEDSGHTAGNTWTEGDKDEGDKDGGDKDEGDKDEGDKDGGGKDGYTGMVVGLSVSGVLVLVIVGFYNFRKHKSMKQNAYQSPAEKSDVNQP